MKWQWQWHRGQRSRAIGSLGHLLLAGRGTIDSEELLERGRKNTERGAFVFEIFAKQCLH